MGSITWIMIRHEQKVSKSGVRRASRSRVDRDPEVDGGGDEKERLDFKSLLCLLFPLIFIATLLIFILVGDCIMDEYDSKLIVTLIVEDHLAEEAWKSNKDRYVSPYDPNDDSADLSSREATPAYQKLESKLELTFGHNPKILQRGFVFGSIPRACDIFLAMRRQFSSGQCFCTTFNKPGRLLSISSSLKDNT